MARENAIVENAYAARRIGRSERARLAAHDLPPSLEAEHLAAKVLENIDAEDAHAQATSAPATTTLSVPSPDKKKPNWRTRLAVGARKAVGWTFIGAGCALNTLFWVPFAVYPGGPIAFAVANPLLAGALVVPALGVGLIAVGYCIRDGHFNLWKAFKGAKADVGKATTPVTRFVTKAWRWARGKKPEAAAEPAPQTA